MSPISNFAIVAFAASALAIPQQGYGWGHSHGHSHSHSHSASGSAASRYSGSVRPYGSSGSVRPTKSLSEAAAIPTYAAPAGHNAGPAAPAASSAGTEVAPVAGAGASGDCGAVTVTQTDKVTVYVTASSGAPASGSSTTTSTTTITVKSTAHVTLRTTIHRSSAGPASSASRLPVSSASSKLADAAGTSSSAAASVANHYNPGGGQGTWTGHWGHPHESSSAAPASSSSSVVEAPAPAAPYTSTSSSSVVAAPAATSPSTTSTTSTSTSTSSSTPPPAPTTTSTSSSAALALPTISIPNILPQSSSSSAAPATNTPSGTYTAPSGGKSGKRGLAYNDASLAGCFEGSSQVSWAYNWASSSSGMTTSGIEYIPLLWGTGSDFTGKWLTNAKAAIAAGSKTVFSFNEPDLSSQANLSPAAAAAAYKTFMMPLTGLGAKLCAPAVTNGGGAMGLNWLSSFLSDCKALGCQIDCLNIHWYDSPENVAYFKSHVTDAITLGGGVPVYVSEFGVNDGGYSADQVTSFLEQVMSWMDGQSGVAGYAYFKVDPKGLTYPLTDNGAITSIGKTYMSYTG